MAQPFDIFQPQAIPVDTSLTKNQQRIGDLIGGQLSSIPQLPQSPFQPGQFEAPSINIETPQANIPTLPTLADVTQQVQQENTFAPQIEALTAQRGQNLIQSLQPIFEQQREAELERLAGRGGIDQGFAGESFRRLADVQAAQAQQGLAEIQTEGLALQLEELQQARDIAAQTGLAQAEIQANFGLQTQRLAQDTAKVNTQLQQEAFFRSQGLELEANKLAVDTVFRQATIGLDKAGLILDAQGRLTEEDRLELEEARSLWDTALKTAAQTKNDREKQAILDELADNIKDYKLNNPQISEVADENQPSAEPNPEVKFPNEITRDYAAGDFLPINNELAKELSAQVGFNPADPRAFAGRLGPATIAQNPDTGQFFQLDMQRRSWRAL